MLIHNFDPVAINFFIFEVRWYSLAYIFGILLGWYCARNIIKKSASINYVFEKFKPSDFDDLIPYLIIGIILGGRLGYVLIYNLNYYLNNLIEILYIWKGGMSFHGGMIGIIVSNYIFTKKKNMNFFYFSDVISLTAPIGLFFGRFANFINAELYGTKTNMPWGVIFSNIDSISRHPSQIYEALLEGLLLFLILNFLAIKKKLILINGLISSLFLILYSIFRFFAEYFREPDQQIGYLFLNLSMGQILSLTMFFIGILLVLKKKNEFYIKNF